MNKKLEEYDLETRESILPLLRPYFDLVTLENCNKYLMQIWYANKSIFESFQTYELNPNEFEKAFEDKKLRLFLDGVFLYYIHSNEQIELICNAYNEEYYNYR
jgi:hypothetical protein